MFTGKYVSNCLGDNINDIKCATLYYDKIEVLNNIVYTITKPDSKGVASIRGVHECVEDEFRGHLKILEAEGVIEYLDLQEDRFVLLGENDEQLSLQDKIMRRDCSHLMETAGNKLFAIEQKNTGAKIRFLDEEVKKVHSRFVCDLKNGACVDLEFICVYYENMIYHMLKYMNANANVITTSKIIDKYFHEYYSKSLLKIANTKKFSDKSIGVKTISQFVPNVERLSFEDVLEVRYRARDELIEYRNYMIEMSKIMAEESNMIALDELASNYIDLKIQPAIMKLQRKISTSNMRIEQTFLDDLKDLKSYIPFLGSIVANLPIQMSILLSAGLISRKAYLKMKEERAEIKNNGLYYLFVLNK